MLFVQPVLPVRMEAALDVLQMQAFQVAPAVAQLGTFWTEGLLAQPAILSVVFVLHP